MDFFQESYADHFFFECIPPSQEPSEKKSLKRHTPGRLCVCVFMYIYIYACVCLSLSFLSPTSTAGKLFFKKRKKTSLGYLETIFPKGRQEGVGKSDGIVAIKKENRAVKKKGEKHSRPTFVTTGVV